jgi:hypothetical protein
LTDNDFISQIAIGSTQSKLKDDKQMQMQTGMYQGTQLDGLLAGGTIRVRRLRYGDACLRESYAHEIRASKMHVL